MTSYQHNVDAKKIQGAIESELAAMVTDIASLVAGAKTKDGVTGIAAVLNKKQGTPTSRSNPGEPPYKQTGNLGRSWKTRKRGKKVGKRIVAIAGSDQDYARFLEFGTARMRPRPYVAAGIDLARPKIRKRIQMARKGVMRELKKVLRPVRPSR